MLEKLRQQYFQTVLVTTTDEELYSVLPNKSFSNFKEIMRGIIKLLAKEIKSNMSSLSREKDEEMILLYKEEIADLQRKLKICEQALQSSYVIEEVPKSIDEEQKNIIIFGVSPAGNVSFLSDLKRDVDIHYYEGVLDLLNSYIDGTALNNPETMKRFTGSNTKLQGIYELRGFQIRIIFQLIESNIIYVDMVRIKKDDRSLKDINEPIKRINLLNKDYERVKRIVKSGEGLEDLIIKNEEVYRDIVEFLESKTKKDGKNNV